MTPLRYAASPHLQPPFLGYKSSNVDGRSRTRQQAMIAERSSSSSTSGRGGQLEDRIREQLLNAELSPSSYDTAWAAMVPAPGSLAASRYPQCVDWILRNQRSDGSWGLDPSLRKDALSSTLACVLALRTWGVGEEHVGKGSFVSITIRGAGLHCIIPVNDSELASSCSPQGSASSDTTPPL